MPPASRCSAPARRLAPWSCPTVAQRQPHERNESGVVQSPSMNDSPRPTSLPVAPAGRTNRRRPPGPRPTRRAPRTGTCGPGTRRSASRRSRRRDRREMRSSPTASACSLAPLIALLHGHGRLRRASPTPSAVIRGTTGTPFHHNLSASRWIAAITLAVIAGWRTSTRRISVAFHGRRSSDSVASKPTEPASLVSM